MSTNGPNLGEDIVGDDGEAVLFSKVPTEGENQRCRAVSLSVRVTYRQRKGP